MPPRFSSAPHALMAKNPHIESLTNNWFVNAVS
jgi:hypothetical protein